MLSCGINYNNHTQTKKGKKMARDNRITVFLSDDGIKFVDKKIKELGVDISRSMMISGLIEQLIKDGK